MKRELKKVSNLAAVRARMLNPNFRKEVSAIGFPGKRVQVEHRFTHEHSSYMLEVDS
jgi:hypothetical protein